MAYRRVRYYHNSIGNPPAIIKMMFFGRYVAQNEAGFKRKLSINQLGRLNPSLVCHMAHMTQNLVDRSTRDLRKITPLPKASRDKICRNNKRGKHPK